MYPPGRREKAGTAPKNTTQPPPGGGGGDGGGGEGDDEQSGWIAAKRQLRIGGVISGPEGKIATIDGKLYEEGDPVVTRLNGFVYRWRIGAIDNDGPELIALKRRPE